MCFLAYLVLLEVVILMNFDLIYFIRTSYVRFIYVIIKIDTNFVSVFC